MAELVGGPLYRWPLPTLQLKVQHIAPKLLELLF